MPRPRPESSFQLCPCPVACILSAFICQINSQKGKPNLRFETISAGKVRTTNPPPEGPPLHLPFRQVLHTKGQSLCPFLFYSFCCCSCCLPSGQLPPPQLSSALLGQHTICDNSFLRINICSACVPVLLGPPLAPLSNPVPVRLRFYLPRCPARPGLPFVCSVCFRTLFKLTCAYFLMVSCVCGDLPPLRKGVGPL